MAKVREGPVSLLGLRMQGAGVHATRVVDARGGCCTGVLQCK
jgi:hypothetical protein